MKLLCLLGCLSLSANGWAQPIHGHPQKTAYGSPAEYPDGYESQFHWMINGQMVHVHLNPICPIYGEFHVGDRVTCRFSVTTFNQGVTVDPLYFGTEKGGGNATVFWDATQSATPPIIFGEDHVAHVWTGHFTTTILPNTSDWWFFSIYGLAHFSDTTVATLEALRPFWSLDPPIASDPFRYHLPVASSRFRVFSPLHPSDDPNVFYGQQTVEVNDLLPLAPISVPWTIHPATYNYGGVLLPSTSEARVDLDLHHDIPGTTLWTVLSSADSVITPPLTFDTALPAGSHKYAVIRTEQDGGEALATLLVFTPTVVGGSEPPPDPMPPPTWVPNTLQPSRLGDLERLCASDGKCIVLGTLVTP